MKNLVTERLDRWFKRNAIGEQKESEGKFDDAIRVYEENVEEGADTLFPYERLVILYNRKHDRRNEIRILKQALSKLRERSQKRRLDQYLDRLYLEMTRRLAELTGLAAEESNTSNANKRLPYL
jgi:hypothetical protein